MPKTNPITHNGQTYWPDANGWYDIECSPKDGHFLAYDAEWDMDERHLGMQVCYWSRSDALCAAITSTFLQDDEEEDMPDGPFNPTHWQPLPKPPVASQQGGE